MLCETEGSEKALFSRFWLFWRPAGVPTAHTAFCGLCFNLSVFYNFIFCFFHYNLILHNLIFRTAQSLQSFFPALVVCQSLFIFAFKVVPIFLFFCVRPSGHDGSNRWLHSGWHFRGYLLKHRFRSAQTFFDRADNAQLQPFYKRAFIESLPAGKPTGATVDSCCTL